MEIHIVLVTANFQGDHWKRLEVALTPAHIIRVDGKDATDPVVRKYRVFQQQTLKAHHEKVYNFITNLRPDVCIANHREFGRGFNRMESNTGMDRALPHWQYSASDNTKRAVCSYPEMVSSNTTVDFINFPYRHVAVSPHQQALRLGTFRLL